MIEFRSGFGEGNGAESFPNGSSRVNEAREEADRSVPLESKDSGIERSVSGAKVRQDIEDLDSQNDSVEVDVSEVIEAVEAKESVERVPASEENRETMDETADHMQGAIAKMDEYMDTVVTFQGNQRIIDIAWGESQDLVDGNIEDLRSAIGKMNEYMNTFVTSKAEHTDLSDECRCRHERCLYWAAYGEFVVAPFWICVVSLV